MASGPKRLSFKQLIKFLDIDDGRADFLDVHSMDDEAMMGLIENLERLKEKSPADYERLDAAMRANPQNVLEGLASAIYDEQPAKKTGIRGKKPETPPEKIETPPPATDKANGDILDGGSVEDDTASDPPIAPATQPPPDEGRAMRLTDEERGSIPQPEFTVDTSPESLASLDPYNTGLQKYLQDAMTGAVPDGTFNYQTPFRVDTNFALPETTPQNVLAGLTDAGDPTPPPDASMPKDSVGQPTPPPKPGMSVEDEVNALMGLLYEGNGPDPSMPQIGQDDADIPDFADPSPRNPWTSTAGMPPEQVSAPFGDMRGINASGGVDGVYGPVPPIDLQRPKSEPYARPVGSRVEAFMKARGLEGVNLRPLTAPLDFAYRNPVLTLGAGAGIAAYNRPQGTGITPPTEEEMRADQEAAAAAMQNLQFIQGPAIPSGVPYKAR